LVNIAILGHGVVGSGVVEVLTKNRESIERKASGPINIKYILDLRDFPGLEYSDRFIKDFNIIAEDSEVDVVVECMGGLEPAYTFVKTCLEAGKSVVTSNKELVAEKGSELLALAASKNINLFFEASVGGGIPIIKPLHLCLGANEIYGIEGILNGTTNFILTKMIREGMGFAQALAEAQRLGYAEKDPTADVEGHDACRKICILASLAFGNQIYPVQVHTEGITGVTAQDVAYAEGRGCVIKLIGRAGRLPNGKIFVMVSPAFVSRESQLSGVDDVYNGILVKGDATGDVMFYGKGAGKLPTASAVVSDVIDAIKAQSTIKTLSWKEPYPDMLEKFENYPVTAYFRVFGENALSKAGAIFPDVRALAPIDDSGETAFITPITTEGRLAAAREALEENGIEVISLIRVLGDD